MVTSEISTQNGSDIEEFIRKAISPKGQHVYVVAMDGGINLSGDVEDFETKKQIRALVEGVLGVRYVQDHIRVAPNTPFPQGWF